VAQRSTTRITLVGQGTSSALDASRRRNSRGEDSNPLLRWEGWSRGRELCWPHLGGAGDGGSRVRSLVVGGPGGRHDAPARHGSVARQTDVRGLGPQVGGSQEGAPH